MQRNNAVYQRRFRQNINFFGHTFSLFKLFAVGKFAARAYNNRYLRSYHLAHQRLLAECRRELEAEQVPLARDIEVGMMVEVPSAAILADQFAQEVDFFSIGTNDLTQYTLAADRLNDKVADLFDSSHPAVLRLIQNTAQAAAARGIWCGICGESAGNEALLPFYIKAGVRELSVVPGKVLELRRALSAIDASTL